MRALIILIVIVLIMVLIGWITIQTNGRNQATITVDTQKMEDDTHKAVEKGGEFVEKTGNSIQNAVRRDDKEDEHGEPAPAHP